MTRIDPTRLAAQVNSSYKPIGERWFTAWEAEEEVGTINGQTVPNTRSVQEEGHWK